MQLENKQTIFTGFPCSFKGQFAATAAFCCCCNLCGIFTHRCLGSTSCVLDLYSKYILRKKKKTSDLALLHIFLIQWSYDSDCPLPFLEGVKTQVGSPSSGRILDDPSTAAGLPRRCAVHQRGRGGRGKSYSLWRWQQLVEDQAPALQAFP